MKRGWQAKVTNRKLAAYVLASVAHDYDSIRLEQGVLTLTPQRRAALTDIAKRIAEGKANRG